MWINGKQINGEEPGDVMPKSKKNSTDRDSKVKHKRVVDIQMSLDYTSSTPMQRVRGTKAEVLRPGWFKSCRLGTG